jgi:DNA-binding protein
MFGKLSDAHKLFNKGGDNHSFFRKVSNTARKIDNSVAKVGNFLSNTANTLGYGGVGSVINKGVDVVHKIRNHLEKAIKAPVGDIRKEHNYA